ncbi:MAG: glycosyltransferase [Planctomycetota bacterium]
MGTPRVSVVIPVRDDPDRLRTCLDALSHQEGGLSDVEVLVVDNASRDPAARVVAEYPFARALNAPESGSYAARNRGIEAARGELIAFTDADCIPERSWLARGSSAVGETGLVAGRVRVFASAADAAGTPDPIESYELATAFPQQQYVRAGYGVTANLFVRRELFAAVGTFDAQLLSGGDLEWGQRARAQGVRVQYCADAVVAHPARKTWHELRRKKVRLIDGEHQRTRQSVSGRWRWRAKLLRTLAPPGGDLAAVWRRRHSLAPFWRVALVALRAHYAQVLRRWQLALG